MKFSGKRSSRVANQIQMRISSAWAIAVVLFAFFVFATAVRAGDPGKVEAYKLAPGDRLTITVIGQPELSGDYPVDGAGNIVFPIVGAVAVGGLTIPDSQQRIIERLADGILVNPSVLVRAAELRPIQVLGDVRAPGSYPFRYGSIVKSAIAQAGGLGAPDRTTAVSDLLVADERVRTLVATQRTLLIRQARLKAQLEGAKTFAPPGTLPGADDPETAKVIAEESEALALEGEAFEKQIELIQSQKPKLQSEEAALQGQISSGKKQLDLVQIELDQYTKVTDRGFGNSHTALELKIAVENKQSDIWRLEAEKSRLQMNILEFDVRLSDVETTRKKQILTELQDVRQKLHESEVALPSARDIRASMLRQSGGAVGPADVRSMRVTRFRDGELSTFDVTETTALEPGDILEIRALRPNDRQAAVSGALSAVAKPGISDGLAQQARQ